MIQKSFLWNKINRVFEVSEKWYFFLVGKEGKQGEMEGKERMGKEGQGEESID